MIHSTLDVRSCHAKMQSGGRGGRGVPDGYPLWILWCCSPAWPCLCGQPYLGAMDPRTPLIFKSGLGLSWRCLCCIASVFALAAAGGVGLMGSSEAVRRGDYGYSLSTRASARQPQQQREGEGVTGIADSAAASIFRGPRTISETRRLQLLEEDDKVRRVHVL